ncbi:TPA: fimbrial biogenesis chaperone [Enterobacter cancerogenus]
MFRFIAARLIPGALCLFISLTAHAGVIIGGTRFIFDADKTGITFTVHNTAKIRYLIVTKIYNDDASSTAHVPFIAIPPLFTVNSGHSNIVRILRTGGDLPDDRESLFWLSIASIPETSGTQDPPGANTLQVAVRSKMKLFYRPAGLKGREEDAYKRLVWKAEGGRLSATNPTPYYVTLFKLKCNGQTVADAGMVAPFSTKIIPAGRGNKPYTIQWQTINDYGGVMPVQQISLK